MQRGASYFFGFLITFVVLLLIFVGCGVVSRRRFSARARARFEWDMEPWAERLEDGVGYIPPVLLEKSFISARHGSHWRDLTPLAALVVSPRQTKRSSGGVNDVPSSPPLPASNQTPLSPPAYGGGTVNNDLEVITRTLSTASRGRSESLTRVSSGHSGPVRITSPMPYHRNPNVIRAQYEAGQQVQQNQIQDGIQEQSSARQRHGRLHYLNPASWFRFLFQRRRERGPAHDMEQGTQGVVYDEKSRKDTFRERKNMSLQVAVLIAMPSQASHVPEGGEQIPAYEIGVASVPWTDDLKEGNYAERSSSSSD